MGKIDRVKEHIGALKIYLAIIVSLAVTLSAGVAKLFIEDSNVFLQWLGIVGILLLSSLFILVARYMHKKIDDLEEL